MKGVMKLLAAARLVELSPEEQADLQAPDADAYAAPQALSEQELADQALIEAAAAMPAAEPDRSAPPPLTPPPLPPLSAGAELPEGRPFDEIYAAAGVPASPYPAERLLRLIDGLRAMDAGTRRTAVQAMDAADDNWTIDDPLLDAQRKVRVLQEWSTGLREQLSASEQAAAAEIAELKATEEKAVAEIRKQIDGLEKLLEREMQKTAEHIAARQASLSAARAALERETQRINAEAGRLGDLARQFGAAPEHSQGAL